MGAEHGVRAYALGKSEGDGKEGGKEGGGKGGGGGAHSSPVEGWLLPLAAHEPARTFRIWHGVRAGDGNGILFDGRRFRRLAILN